MAQNRRKKTMKKMLVLIVLALVLSAPAAYAASSIVPSLYSISKDGTLLVVKLVCTAHTDGAFDPKQITNAEIIPTGSYLPVEYQNMGYVLAHAWSVNSATDDHTNAAVVTVTDETGQVIVGAAVGDTLTLSQAASGITYLVVVRGSSQRAVTSKLTVAIADTGSTATVQTLYLLLRREILM
jgi:hypothetical protein